MSFLRPPGRYKKIKKRSHFQIRAAKRKMRGAGGSKQPAEPAYLSRMKSCPQWYFEKQT
jgi:hypothetical protein